MSSIRCQALLYSLMDYSCQPEFSLQMKIARELFAISTGKVNDDDPFYDMRMSIFQEYFLFDYRLSDIFSGCTVFETFLLNAQSQLQNSELHEFEQFRNFRRSLFKVKQIHENGLLVHDLFSNYQEFIEMLPDFSTNGFDNDLIFEGRIICFKGKKYYTGSFIFHPKEIKSIIEKNIKDFFKHGGCRETSKVVNWQTELQRRHEVLSAVAEQKRILETTEKKKSIEILKVNQNMANLANSMTSANYVMAIGNNEHVSPFIPETPLYQQNLLIDHLAYLELKSMRYKHIDPRKIYAATPENNALPLPTQTNKKTANY